MKHSPKTAAIILAAGQGTRMRSKLPKVLHPVGGVPMVAHVVQLALARRCCPVVVVIDKNGRRIQEALRARFKDAPLEFAVQEKQRGTGDATRAGLAVIPKFRGRVLILYGDVPLLTSATVGRLQKAATRADVALLSACVDDPFGYGRVVREGRRVTRVVEQKDASAEHKEIDEINVGVYVCESKLLRRTVGALRTNNAQKELYLTDVVEAAAAKGGAVAVKTANLGEVQGINDRMQLAVAESTFRWRRIEALMRKGVTFQDPDSAFIDAGVEIATDAVIGVGVQLRGSTIIDKGALIEGPTVIKDSRIGAGAHVYSFCHIDQAQVGKQAQVGPFARLRVGADLASESKVGNFVEMKKARLGKGAKANHLAYIGDADIGAKSNVGAGTITCNYDGKNKNKTSMGAGVFVGSNSTLVAPVKLGAGSYIGAGSTITDEVPKNALALGRGRQVNLKGYAVKLRKKIQAQASASTKSKRGK